MDIDGEETFLMHKFWIKQSDLSLTSSFNNEFFDINNEVNNNAIDIFKDENQEDEFKKSLQVSLLDEDETTNEEIDQIDDHVSEFKILNGKDINDVPAQYVVPTLKNYEFPAVGTYIDRRIVPGFKYRVRSIDSEDYIDDYLFDGQSLMLQSIGCGYSRRITFSPPPGRLNDNPNYFWSDSRKYGFAFQPELVSVGEKYTVYDVSHHPIGHLEISEIQYPQQELSHKVLDDKSVEKSATVRAVAKLEWLDTNEICVVSICGTAICVKPRNSFAKITRIIGVTISGRPRRNFCLYPGVDNKKRCILVNGENCNDIPINYCVVGLEIYELPVIGTFIDPRILPGFCYKVRPINCKTYLFNGRTLCLLTIGNGYSKKLVFEADDNCLNSNQNYFWTDSWPSGFGFELRAVHCSTKFSIYTDDRYLGFASVFRVDNPQYEEKHTVLRNSNGVTVVKYVHVDITCHVTLCMSENKNISKICDEKVMRISGSAVIKKSSTDKRAKLCRIENIGLDSQLNVLFFVEHTNLVFYAE